MSLPQWYFKKQAIFPHVRPIFIKNSENTENCTDDVFRQVPRSKGNNCNCSIPVASYYLYTSNLATASVHLLLVQRLQSVTKEFYYLYFQDRKTKKQRVHGKCINDANNLQNQCKIIIVESTVLSITTVFTGCELTFFGTAPRMNLTLCFFM